MTIKMLPDYLISQIAAGEIILRPAYALKELLENSIDSGATKIEVNIEGGGIESLVVSDNGSGISKTDLPLALKRHATSKISKFEDLSKLKTFGFRGEALASLSEVSDLSIISQINDNTSIAYELTTSDREINLKPTTRAVGTTVIVRDLFYNLPVRRKFLRTEKSETLALMDTFKSAALAAPNIEFILNQKNRTLLNYFVLTDDKELLRSYRVKSFLKGIDIFVQNSINDNNYQLEAWISLNQKPQYRKIIVNNRVVKCLLTLQAIRSAINSIFNLPDASNIPFTLEQCLQSSFIVYIDMPSDSLDINIHPAKEEVKYLENKAIYGLVYNGIFQAFLNNFINKNVSVFNHETSETTEGINLNLPKEQNIQSINTPSYLLNNNSKQNHNTCILTAIEKDFFSSDIRNQNPKNNDLENDTEIHIEKPIEGAQLNLNFTKIQEEKKELSETTYHTNSTVEFFNEPVSCNEIKTIFSHRGYILFKNIDVIIAYKISDILSEAIINNPLKKTILEKPMVINFPDGFNEINDHNWVNTIKGWGFEWNNFGTQAILTHVPNGCEIILWDKCWIAFYKNKDSNIARALEYDYIVNSCIIDDFSGSEILSWLMKIINSNVINLNNLFFKKLYDRAKIIHLNDLLNL